MAKKYTLYLDNEKHEDTRYMEFISMSYNDIIYISNDILIYPKQQTIHDSFVKILEYK